MMSNSNCNSNRSVAMESVQATGPEGGLKKGPWTAAEDAILVEYVKKHGEGNWNSMQKNSGLMRCGKSCRLRWANHLRPNLKKGSFTPDEERIIIELHAKHGNKWARMASQLPGRTDNEIKNYWNTRMKRRQRAGLPIYPQDLQAEAAAFHFHHHKKDRQTHPNSSTTPLSSLLSSSPYNLSFSLLDPINNFSTPSNLFQNHLSPFTFYSNPSHQLNLFVNSNTNDDNLQRSPCSTNLFNKNPSRQEIPINTPSLFYNDADMENNMSFTSLIMGAQVQTINFIPGLNYSELSSYQIPPGQTTSCGGTCVVEASDKSNNHEHSYSETHQQGMAGSRDNSGLLDALLLEAKTLSFKRAMEYGTIKEESVEEEAPKRVKLSLRNGSENSFGEKLSDDFSSAQSSNIGVKPGEEAIDRETNSMDDELINLLNNFPSSEPFPELYRRSRNTESNFNRPSFTHSCYQHRCSWSKP